MQNKFVSTFYRYRCKYRMSLKLKDFNFNRTFCCAVRGISRIVQVISEAKKQVSNYKMETILIERKKLLISFHFMSAAAKSKACLSLKSRHRMNRRRLRPSALETELSEVTRAAKSVLC